MKTPTITLSDAVVLAAHLADERSPILREIGKRLDAQIGAYLDVDVEPGESARFHDRERFNRGLDQ